MINLYDYVRKEVKVFYLNGDIVTGFVTQIDSVESNENGIESMTLEDTGRAPYWEVGAEEIKSIEVIE